MNEEVSDRTVRLAGRTTKITAVTLYRLLRAAYRHHVHKKMEKGMKPLGEQSVKTLIKQGQGASSMDVSGESIKDFKRIANKYGVDFAIVKDKDVKPSRYTVFFKAKDADAIGQVLKEYSKRIVKRQERKNRPSILQRLKKLKAIIAKRSHKEKEKKKEQVL